MLYSIDDEVIKKMKKAGRGTLFFVDDFLNYGSAKAVSKALERLVNRKEVDRVSRGIYSRLQQDPVWGTLKPTVEDIAEAIRRRDKARIIPTGTLALNALGLSTQVPMNPVYLTDGAARTINVGKRKIVFKKTSPKNLATIGNISTLAIQAMKEIGKENISELEIEKILKNLKNEDPFRLEYDIRFAPEWIRIILRKAIKSKKE